MTACIVGWSHGKFGKLDGETSESLVVKAATEAIAHAGIEPKDVDVIYVGNMNGGFVRQEFHSSLALQAHPDLRFKPSTRVENACATGSAAIHMGLNTLAAGKARFVLVVGHFAAVVDHGFKPKFYGFFGVVHGFIQCVAC